MTRPAIVVDSSCDLHDELREQLNVTAIPFTMTLGDSSYTDDTNLHLPSFLQALKQNSGRVGSAAPSPLLFKEAFERSRARYAVTISSRLSASYENALLGSRLSELPESEKPHIFDSLSASAGEVLVALKIGQLLKQGLQHLEIVHQVEAVIRNMKTYFVLENIDNLLKNGRLNKIAGKLTSLLNIKPVLGSDGQGNIKLYGYGRSRKSLVAKLVETISHSNRVTEDATLVITHCNNQVLAELLAQAVAAKHRFAEVHILPTRGLSSVYADEQGVIMAY